MKRIRFNKLIIVTLVVLLAALPIVGCAPKAPPPPPPPPPAPPAGTIAVDPPEIAYATLEAIWPGVGAALGIPEAAIPAFPAGLAALGLPIKFTGSGWPANEIVTIDLVIPADVDMPGLGADEDSVGVAFATADADGNFEATMEPTAKLNWLMRTEWTPLLKPDITKVRFLPNDVYTLRAVGIHPETVTTITWKLELVAPEAEEAAPPPEEEAAPPPAGELSFEAAEYANADYGFSVQYPKEWKEAESPAPAIVFYAASPAMVPVLFVAVEEGATFVDALTAALEAAGASGIKIVSESETTLADGTPASEVVLKLTLKGFAADGFALGVKKDNKWIMPLVGTVDMLFKYDEVLFSEIVHTLQFK